MDQADIVPTEMVFTIKEPPRLGHVVKMTNSSDSTASPVLDYIHTFTQEDVDQGRILYVSASVQVDCHLLCSGVENQCSLSYSQRETASASGVAKVCLSQ